MNNKIKKSFGTAFKILDWRKIEKSTALVSATVIAWAFAPESKIFWDTLFSPETYHIIAARFLPN